MQRNLMRGIVPLALMAAAVWLIAAGGSSAVTFIGHDRVVEALSKGGNLVTAPDLIVLGSHRAAPGRVEVHEKETDTFYVIDGSATIVTGGTMIGGKSTKPGQWLGSDIQGGEARHLTKGDVMVIPAGVPHWFKEVSPSISYYVVKVLKP